MTEMRMFDMHGTTVLAVRKDGRVAMAGDGQVTMGDTVMKGNARKVRRIYDDKILVGFAGGTADAFTLLERFEGNLNEYGGDLTRAAVELAKEWRTDRMLRRLEALLLVSNREQMYLVSGTGDVVEPDVGAIAIGSGGNFALAAALAYLDAGGPSDGLSAREIALRSLGIAGRICIYTNTDITVEELE
ncbi:MAG: ATP-dependent protease subunit HslV [Spirochaetia bacterium]